MKILMVLTSHDKLGNTGRKTGFWLEEFAAPYYTFKEAGAEIVLASPKGGQPPLDPKSNEPNFQTDLTHRFEADPDAKARLATTLRLDSVKAEDFDTVFYPGGHGPMWDLAEDQNSIDLLETMFRTGKPLALVCHAPGALRHVKTPDGRPLVQGKRVTGFTNTEEEAVGLTKVVTLPRRGRVEGEGRPLFQGRRLAALRPRRWPADHRSEPGLVRSRGEGADRDAEQIDAIQPA
jgi:putative intracellular protease/amidase